LRIKEQEKRLNLHEHNDDDDDDDDDERLNFSVLTAILLTWFIKCISTPSRWPLEG